MSHCFLTVQSEYSSGNTELGVINSQQHLADSPLREARRVIWNFQHTLKKKKKKKTSKLTRAKTIKDLVTSACSLQSVFSLRDKHPFSMPTFSLLCSHYVCILFVLSHHLLPPVPFSRHPVFIHLPLYRCHLHMNVILKIWWVLKCFFHISNWARILFRCKLQEPRADCEVHQCPDWD